MAELEMNFGSFLANFQKNNVVLSSIASKLEKASDATERTEILKNEENSERLRSIRQSLDFISRSEESLESFQKQAVSAGFDYEKLNKSLRAMEKTFEKMSKMDLDPSLVTTRLVGVIDDSSSSLEKVIRDMSFDLMENANPLFKTLNILDKRMENLSKTVDNQTTFLTSGVDNYREMVDYSSRIISLMKEKKSDLVRILEEAPQRLESLKQRETQLLSQVREITLFKELKQRESELESEKTTLAEAPQKIEQLKERETTLESKTVGVARLGELRDKESELRTRESETRESTEMSSEEKDRALQAISVEMDQIQLELNTSEVLREVASMTEDQVLAISTELEEVRAEISRLPENEEARLEAFRQVENKLSEISIALDGIPMEVKSLTKEQIESITGELNGVQHEIGKLPKTLEERSAVARTLEGINRSINTISDGLKENIEYSPVVKVVTEGLKPVNKAMEKMAFDIAFREAAYGEIDKMGWFRVMSEISLNKKETKILEDQEKLLRKQLIEIDKRSDINEEEKTLMKKKTMEALENVSGEKEKRVGRGEKLEERRKQGAFAKFFDGIKKSLDGLSSRLKEAAGSWVTKLLLGLFVFGFLIKRGLISTDTVAKVLSFLLKLLVEGLKVAVELIFVGLGAVFGVITDLFKNGDYLGGILLTLAVTLTSLLVLGKVIALATSLWSGIVLGAGALKMGFNFLKETFGVMSSVWNNSFFQTARSGLMDGISNMFSGITTAIKNTSKGAFDTIKNTLENTFGKGIGNFFGGLLPKKKTPSLMPETPAAGPKKSIWTTIGDALKALGTNEALKGAAVVAILAGAIFVVAKAFEAFTRVSWGGVAKGFVALTALVGIALFVKQIKNDILQGSIAIAALGLAMLGLGYGLIQFNEIGLGAIFKGLAALTALIFIARLVKEQATNIIIGAVAIGILAAALIPLGFALSLISGVGVGQIIAFTVAVGLLVGIAALAGSGFALIAMGAGALALLGLSMLTFIPIVRSLSGIDASSLLGFATAIGLLVGIAALAGLGIGLISLGSAALLILAAGLAASIYLIGLAINSLSGVDFGIITPFSEGIWTLARAVMWLAPFSPLIVLGSVALAALGVAIMPFAKAMSILNGVTIDLQQIANLDKAIQILAWRAVKEAAFVVPILAGALAIGALGLAVLPFAQAMNLLNGVVIDLQQITNLDKAIQILAWRAVKEAPFILPIMLGGLAMQLLANALSSFLPFIDFLVKSKFDMNQMLLFSQAVAILTFSAVTAGLMLIPVLLGSFVLGVLARSLENFIPIINSLKGVDGNAVMGFGMSVMRVVRAAVYAGGNLIGVYLGANALDYLGKKLVPFASVLQYLHGVDPKSMIAFSFAIRSLVVSAFHAGRFLKEIKDGSGALAVLGSSLTGFANTFSMLSSIKPEAIISFVHSVVSLTFLAIYAGSHQKEVFGGSTSLEVLAESLTSFVNRMKEISGVSPESMLSFASTVRRLLDTAVLAGLLFPAILLGSIGLLLLGNSLTMFGESLSKIKGLKTEDADAFSYSIKKMIDLIKDIGFFEGLEIVAKVSLVGGSLKQFGESLIPFGVAMSNLGNFDPNSLSTISRGINDLVNEMLYLGEYGDTTAFMEFFGSLVEIAPAIESFSAVMNYFGSALTSVNREMFTFTDLLSQLTHLPDPLYELADSLHELSLSLGEMRTTVSSISDEDMLKIIRVFGLTTTMSTQGARRTTLEGRSTSRFMSDRSTPSMSNTSEWREYTIANELATPGKPLSNLQVAAIDTALSMSPNNAANYPSWVLDDYARQKGRERTTLPRGTDFVPSSRTSRNLVTNARAAVDTMATGATGVPDSQRLEKQLDDLRKRGPISRSGQAEDVHREQIALFETAIRVAKARESRATPATTMVADGRAAVDTMATGATGVPDSQRLEKQLDDLRKRGPISRSGQAEDVHREQIALFETAIRVAKARESRATPATTMVADGRAAVDTMATTGATVVKTEGSNLEQLRTSYDQLKASKPTGSKEDHEKQLRSLQVQIAQEEARVNPERAKAIMELIGKTPGSHSILVDALASPDFMRESTSNVVGITPEAKTLVEIKTILFETKEMQMQSNERGGNAVIMQNNNANVSNNTSQANVIRPMTPVDRFFSRMKFRHQIS